MKYKILLISFLATFVIGCEDLDTENLNNPTTSEVLASGQDLNVVLSGGYLSFWQGVTDSHPAMALAVTGDQYGISWGNFGMRRMGEEPRQTYNNRASESADYKQVVDDPWFGCLSAISTANDIINALDNGITVDNGGDSDISLRSGAYFLRGIARGYIGLIFDRVY